MLIALAVIDFETGYLPDALTLPLLVLGLAANGAEGNGEVEAQVKAQAEALCRRFPIYEGM